MLGQPGRGVHIGDRESDIYELFNEAQKLGTHFLVRTCVDRFADDGRQTINKKMSGAGAPGLHRVEVRDKKGRSSKVLLEVKYQKVTVLPPAWKSKQYPEHTLSVIHALEKDPPKDRERIHWKLITDLPVESMGEAIEKLNWYALRWKIETFHKILKSGCKAEESKLRTSQRLTNLVAVLCLVGWRVYWLTMSHRCCPDAPAKEAFTSEECDILDQMVENGEGSESQKGTLSLYLKKLARLGGYLARASDPPPGNMVMWRGMARLTGIHLGFLIGSKLVGN